MSRTRTTGTSTDARSQTPLEFEPAKSDPCPLPQGAEESIDYLKASRDEALLLDIPWLRERLTLLITDGARGATLLTRSDETHVPAVPATEVDATGAGDCFLAGFAVALSRGVGPLAAMDFANHCGALAVAQVGLPRSLPL